MEYNKNQLPETCKTITPDTCNNDFIGSITEIKENINITDNVSNSDDLLKIKLSKFPTTLIETSNA